MKVAISTDGGFVSAHFGRCPSFTIVEVKEGKVTGKKVVDNPGHQPGLIPQFLKEKGVECIVAGGMGMRATGLFTEFGIRTIVGISGAVEDVIKQVQEGTLKGGESLCKPGSGKGYGLEKNMCDHPETDDCGH